MVAMMSLKSKAVMAPLLLLSFCANAWRACSNCSSCSNTHGVKVKISVDKRSKEFVPMMSGITFQGNRETELCVMKVY